jgi:hypothetical protein
MGNARIISQILMLTNNRAVRWSLALSVLSPFIRFWNNLTALQAAAVISALVLTIGAIVEYWYKLKLLASLLLKWILRKSTPFDRCVFKRLLLHSIGPILVVLGIAGEVVFEGRTFVVEDRQEEQARNTIGSLSQKATAASAKADSASGESDAVSKEADAIQKRLDEASKQLSELEHQFSIQGPRWKVLEARKNILINALKPFAGQKILIVYCGQWGTVAPEPFRVAQDLMNFLAKGRGLGWEGARWEVGGGTWNTCGAGGGTSAGGNLILVSSAATENVKGAAHALDDALNAIEISTVQTEARPTDAGDTWTTRFLGPGSPWELAAKDPTSVVLLIGDNPMFDMSGWKDRHAARQKKSQKR